MSKIIVTDGNRQILPVQERIEHPNDVTEVVLAEYTPSQRFLIYSVRRRHYWRAPSRGTTPYLAAAHRYTLAEAIEMIQAEQLGTPGDAARVRQTIIPAPEET